MIAVFMSTLLATATLIGTLALRDLLWLRPEQVGVRPYGLAIVFSLIHLASLLLYRGKLIWRFRNGKRVEIRKHGRIWVWIVAGSIVSLLMISPSNANAPADTIGSASLLLEQGATIVIAWLQQFMWFHLYHTVFGTASLYAGSRLTIERMIKG